MKAQKHWYLLSYDIREPRRLRRFHYRVSKLALPLQESVFLLQANPQKLQELDTLIQQLAHTREDDIRLYPVRNPGAIWTAGRQGKALAGLFPNRNRMQPERSRLGQLLHRLFG